MYGSSRLGIYQAQSDTVRGVIRSYDHSVSQDTVAQAYFGIDTLRYNKFLVDSIHYLHKGRKRYEGTNHLGNVLVAYTDKRLTVCTNDTIHYYRADVVNAYEYSPFGAIMPDRKWDSDTTLKYRFGFNGQEKDDEISGEGNSMTAEFWQYDGRLGRRWNYDPVIKTEESPYSCFANNPIIFVDPNGADTVTIHKTITTNIPSCNMDGNCPAKPTVTQNTAVEHIKSDGIDVFYYSVTMIINNGKDGTTSTSTTTKQFDPVNKGWSNIASKSIDYVIWTHTVYLDDQWAAAELIPKDILTSLKEKSWSNYQSKKDAYSARAYFSYRTALGYQKDLPVVNASVWVSEFGFQTWAGGVAYRIMVPVKRASDVIKSGSNAYNHGLKYDPRVAVRQAEDPVSHGFSYSFDDLILKTKPRVDGEGYKVYTLRGTMNGKPGNFEIGVLKGGVIDHRFFRPFPKIKK